MVLLLEYYIGLIVLSIIPQEIFEIAGFNFSSFGLTRGNVLKNCIRYSLLLYIKNCSIFSSKEIILLSTISLLWLYSFLLGRRLVGNLVLLLSWNKLSISSWSKKTKILLLNYSKKGSIYSSVTDNVEESILYKVKVR